MLLVVVFLTGMTTQAFSTNQLNVDQNPGIKHRYDKTQSIRFVENGVLYEVYTNGTFDFTVINPAHLYNRGRRNHQVLYRRSAPGVVNYVEGRRNHYRRQFIQTDRFGNIVQIGSTLITYKRNGRVKSIGIVPMRYHRGTLIQVGNMQIVYNRFGNIKRTIGYVNRFNRKVWHDDWYTIDDCDYDDDYWDDYDDDFYDDRRRQKRKRKK